MNESEPELNCVRVALLGASVPMATVECDSEVNNPVRQLIRSDGRRR